MKVGSGTPARGVWGQTEFQVNLKLGLTPLAVGDERRWRRRDDPHAHCVQPGRTLPEPDRVAEFGALEEAREMCMVSPELVNRGSRLTGQFSAAQI